MSLPQMRWTTSWAFTDERRLLALLATATIGHGFLWLALPLPLQTLAVFMITAWTPGALLVGLLLDVDGTTPTWPEWLLHGIGAGFVVQALGMLALSYVPGGLLPWQVLLSFDCITLVLFAISWWRKLQVRQSDLLRGAPATLDLWRVRPSLSLVVGIVALLFIGGFYRFTNLGYAEFHGDEARSVLRAAGVVQGSETVLLIHRKGPVEILIPATMLATTGHIDETSARLPFALASLAALYVVWMSGWFLHSSAAGWLAAFLLAIDGYFIAFGRFVQYQSIVILFTMLTVMVLVRLVRRPQAIRGHLILAALYASVGLLGHYDALLAWPPIAVLLALLAWRQRSQFAGLIKSVTIAALVGAGCLVLYYLPFLLFGDDTAVANYVLTERIFSGGQPPYNALEDFFLRGSLYNSPALLLVFIGLTLAALFVLYVRSYGRWRGALFGMAGLAVVALSFWRSNWLQVGAVDLTFAPFFLLLGLVLLGHHITAELKMLWLWFGFGFILSLFFVAFPRTHVYIFFTAWALLAGQVIADAWSTLAPRLSHGVQRWLPALAVCTALVMLGGYPYWLFVYNQAEVLRTWSENQPKFSWMPAAAMQTDGLYGFPLTNGWKVVGALYAQGVLSGDYDTNQRYMWIPDWYTLGQTRCHSTAQWYFAVDQIEPWAESKATAVARLQQEGWTQWGVVEVQGSERMLIYQRPTSNGSTPTAARRLRLEEYEPQFDATVSVHLPLSYPVVEPRIANRVRVNLADQVLLVGYQLDAPASVTPGAAVRLTLYWKAQRRLQHSYKVFVQAYFGDGQMVAQQDSLPVCDREPTNSWTPGEIVEDVRDLQIADDAPDGVYPLVVGMYLEETGARLSVLDDGGASVSDHVQLGELHVQRTSVVTP